MSNIKAIMDKTHVYLTPFYLFPLTYKDYLLNNFFSHPFNWFLGFK